MAELVDGRLIIDYNLGTKPVIKNFNIENGRLYANYVDEYANVKAKSITILNKHIIAEGEDMAKVDLGRVVGADGKDAVIDETVSGKIASFRDSCVGMPLKSLVAEITPVQSGSGDPSPTNIRPISGRTGLTVTRAGRNICPIEKQPIIEALWGSDVRGMVAFLNTLPTGTYTLSNKYRIVTAPTSGNGVQHGALYVTAIINGAQTPVNTYRTVTDTSPSVGKVYQESTTFTITDAIAGNINHCFVYCDNTTHTGTGRGTYECYDIQLEVGSTATAYEPYDGQTYPITWETEAGTVYGGTLDVVSGVLTVDKAMVNLGTLNFRLSSSVSSIGGSVFWTSISELGMAIRYRHTPNTMLSSIFATAPTERWFINSMSDNEVFSDGTHVYFSASQYTDVTAFKTAMSGVQLVYELATPQTYQLTPTEVRTILGENNIYTDAGDVSVEYTADTKMYIDKRLNTTQMMIAGVETSFVATKNYAIGDFVIVNDTLYRITAVITSGETITPGTNASETTVAEQFTVKNGTKGSKGDTGATGATGPKGDTGGHLYADYDNPYDPNA